MNEDEYKQVSYISHDSNYFIAKDKNFIVVLKKSWIKVEKARWKSIYRILLIKSTNTQYGFFYLHR